MKVEIAAIMERCGMMRALAITPDASRLYTWSDDDGWLEMSVWSALERWNFRAKDNRKIYRGIFTIEVK